MPAAYGVGVAPVSWDGQHDAGRLTLPADREALPETVRERLEALEARGRVALAEEGIAARDVGVERRLDLRYVGTETALAVREPADGAWGAAADCAVSGETCMTMDDRVQHCMGTR